jgi:hypothetical protein
MSNSHPSQVFVEGGFSSLLEKSLATEGGKSGPSYSGQLFTIDHSSPSNPAHYGSRHDERTQSKTNTSYPLSDLRGSFGREVRTGQWTASHSAASRPPLDRKRQNSKETTTQPAAALTLWKSAC